VPNPAGVAFIPQITFTIVGPTGQCDNAPALVLRGLPDRPDAIPVHHDDLILTDDCTFRIENANMTDRERMRRLVREAQREIVKALFTSVALCRLELRQRILEPFANSRESVGSGEKTVAIVQPNHYRREIEPADAVHRNAPPFQFNWWAAFERGFPSRQKVHRGFSGSEHRVSQPRRLCRRPVRCKVPSSRFRFARFGSALPLCSSVPLRKSLIDGSVVIILTRQFDNNRHAVTIEDLTTLNVRPAAAVIIRIVDANRTVVTERVRLVTDRSSGDHNAVVLNLPHHA
jgi:hypothetical protein